MLPDAFRRPFTWLASAALVALAPKCLLCVVAYATAGAALGFGGREICGGTASSTMTGTFWLVVPAVVLGIVGFVVGRRPRRAPQGEVANADQPPLPPNSNP